MNGAFALLRCLGFRFLPALSALDVPGETVVRTPVAVASLPTANVTHVPPFKSRDLDGFALACQYIAGRVQHGCNWVKRNNVSAALGFNGFYAPAPVGPVEAPTFPPGFSATVYNLLTPAGCPHDVQRTTPCPALAAAKPEWFICLNRTAPSRTDPSAHVWPCSDVAMQTNDGTQPCWSNPDLVALLIDQVRRVLRANPQMTAIDVSGMDGGYLVCPADKMANQRVNNTAGAYFEAINSIADATADAFPAVEIVATAYQASQVPPPASAFRFRPNVVIRVCLNAAAGPSDDCSLTPGGCALPLSKPLADPANRIWYDRIVAWKKVAAQVWVWQYVGNFQYTIAPQPLYLLLGDDIQTLDSLGVTGYFAETSSDIGEEMASLKAYVIGQKLLDPSLDTKALVWEFVSSFYGAAAAHTVMHYCTLMDNATRARGGYRPGVVRTRGNALEGNYEWGPWAAAFSNRTMFEAAAALTAAFRATASTKFQARVGLVLLSVQYVMLVRWNEFKAWVDEQLPGRWPLHATLDEELAVFATTFNSSGLLKNGDDGAGRFQGSVTGGCAFGCLVTLGEFEQQVRHLNPPPAAPTHARLAVSPSAISTGTWVTASFSGISHAELEHPTFEYVCKHDGDCTDVEHLSIWIGIFPGGSDRSQIGPQSWACANAPWLATSPMKWQVVNSTSGAVRFFIETTAAAQLDVVLYSNGTTWPVALAVAALNCTDAQRPMHLRLARTQAPCEMRVSFSAKNFDSTASVRWGEVSGSYPHVSRAEATTYTSDDMCGPPATTHGMWPTPYFYSAIIGGDGTKCEGCRIYYQV
jgi:hypothetical protein